MLKELKFGLWVMGVTFCIFMLVSTPQKTKVKNPPYCGTVLHKETIYKSEPGKSEEIIKVTLDVKDSNKREVVEKSCLSSLVNKNLCKPSFNEFDCVNEGETINLYETEEEKGEEVRIKSPKSCNRIKK